MVALEVYAHAMALTIDCKKYQNIDPYLDFMEALVKSLLESDPFIQLQRIGIRKIGGSQFNTSDEIYRMYEKDFVFSHIVEDESLIQNRDYTDFFVTQDRTVKSRYHRLFRRLFDPSLHKDVFQVVLDMDAFIDAEIMQEKALEFPTDIHKILFDNINNYLFELFKKSVTLNYLQGYAKNK